MRQRHAERRRRLGIAVLIVALGIGAYLLTLPRFEVWAALGAIPEAWRPHPAFWALVSIGVYLSISCLVTKSPHPLQVVIGSDGRLSASKFQFFLWTGVVLFTFVLIVAERWAGPHGAESLPDLPRNVLLAMGFSITTLATAKGITVSYTNSGRIAKPDADPTQGAKMAGLVAKDDLQTPDLTKIQMLVWTIVGAVVYLARVFGHLSSYAVCVHSPTSQCFPDIDAVLMVLMGLGQGAYLGGKLTMADTAGITRIAPNPALPGQQVTITGQMFGNSPVRNALGFGAMNGPLLVDTWSDSAISFTVPTLAPNGMRWNGDEEVDLVLMIDGGRAEGDCKLRIALPNIGVVHVDRGGMTSRLTVDGGPFGARMANSQISIGTTTIAASDARVVKWSDSQIEIVDPGMTGEGLAVKVTVNGYSGRPGLATL